MNPIGNKCPKKYPLIPEREPLLRAKLHPNGKSLYVIAYIWRTKADQRAVIRAVEPKDWDDSVQAIFHENEPEDYDLGIPRRQLGEIHYRANMITAGVVVHEFIHAGLAYAKRKRWKIQDDGMDEELFCWAVDTMVNPFMVAVGKAGIL